jgi:MFS family permease
MVPDAPRATAHAWYAMVILTLANVSSFVDRQILAMLVGPIKRDLGLTDTGISLLMGIGFALFYTILGFPVARLADRRSRRAIIAAGVAIWSLMTAASGAARNYTQLLLARIGIGVGEATLNPAAYSLIADTFPAARHGTAYGVYTMGTYLGVGISQLVGGAVIAVVSASGQWELPVVGAVHPWQVVFFAVGLPGFLLALLMFTIREPARLVSAAAVPVREVIRQIRGSGRAIALHNAGAGLLAMVNYGMGAWLPTFFVRTYGWSVSDAGYVLGAGNLTGGIAGVVLAGRLADRLQARGILDARLRVMIGAGLGLLLCDVAAPLMPTGQLAALWIFPLSFFASAPFGVAAAALQQLVPSPIRAQAAALYLFVLAFVGLTGGPTAVGLVTDYVFRDESALRYSLVVVAAVGLTAGIGLLVAGLRPFREAARTTSKDLGLRT